ncbi:hypothetical protein [Kitasatospora atroaurantiaca]|uniref:Uncharacterized protein n=1 Tax=Kitasatospora atroaurantiaca TaxID=285545 RepID=A0A561EMV9_9ACTN|nr:hypothetical protein [Kitasatospora atroaurantiaca]TWE16947.1 hypothetical protein FB465_1942 [Kitasatospora atroaurantiaca]
MISLGLLAAGVVALGLLTAAAIEQLAWERRTARPAAHRRRP